MSRTDNLFLINLHKNYPQNKLILTWSRVPTAWLPPLPGECAPRRQLTRFTPTRASAWRHSRPTGAPITIFSRQVSIRGFLNWNKKYMRKLARFYVLCVFNVYFVLKLNRVFILNNISTESNACKNTAKVY